MSSGEGGINLIPLVPSKVEYSLTPLGKTIIPLLDALCDWAIEHMRIPMIDDDEIVTCGTKKKK